MNVISYNGHNLGKLDEWLNYKELAQEAKQLGKELAQEAKKSTSSFEEEKEPPFEKMKGQLSPFFDILAKNSDLEVEFYNTLGKTLSQRSLAPITTMNKQLIEVYKDHRGFQPILLPAFAPAILEEINLIFLHNLGIYLERGWNAEILYANLSRRHQVGLGPLETLNKARIEEYLKAGPYISAHLDIEGREPHPHFHYLKGSAVEKSKDENAHAIMTLNACMMDKDLPQQFGGMSRAKLRMEKLAHLIQEHNPDVFVGQEVTLTSGCQLFEHIRESYAHVWAGIGASPGSQLSALFVASKYPLITQPQYFPFPEEMQLHGKTEDLKRGFICLETPGYWVVTTHMEAGSPENSAEYRRKQLRHITEKMDELTAETKKPYVVMGDLNIERTAKEEDEYSQSGIAEQYDDFYTKQHSDFDENTMTCTNLFTARANGQSEPVEDEERNEIDDYVLIRKGYTHNFEGLDVKLVTNTFDLEKPWTEAITDHRAYVAQFALRDTL